ARQRKTLLRRNHVADALAGIQLVEVFKAEQLCVLSEIADLCRTLGIGVRFAAIRGRYAMVDDQECLLWRLHPQSGLAKCREGLRAIHLVHEVAVDIEQASAVRLLVHEMIVPDLFKKRQCQGVPLTTPEVTSTKVAVPASDTGAIPASETSSTLPQQS